MRWKIELLISWQWQRQRQRQRGPGQIWDVCQQISLWKGVSWPHSTNCRWFREWRKKNLFQSQFLLFLSYKESKKETVLLTFLCLQKKYANVFSLLLPLLLWVWDTRSTSPQKRFVICGFACFCSAAAQVFSFSQNFLGGHLLKHREILSCCHQQSCKVPFQEGIFRRIFFPEETLIRKRGKLCKTTFLEEFCVANCKRYEGEKRTQLFPCTQIASRQRVILLKVRTQKICHPWKCKKKTKEWPSIFQEPAK